MQTSQKNEAGLALASRIGEARKISGVKQNELAQMIGISPQRMNKIEKGQYVSPMELYNISLALKVNIVDFFEKDSLMADFVNDDLPIDVLKKDRRASQLLKSWRLMDENGKNSFLYIAKLMERP
jgi:DNA-binding XRE family transcriptional regulator